MLQNDQQSVTKEAANLLQSHEQRTFGETAKGEVTSQAQRILSENEKRGVT